MSDLDYKLKMILREYDPDPDNVPPDMFDKEVAAIKQVFFYAGWIIPNNSTSLYMTGREWYDRFENEYVKLESQKSGGTVLPRTNAMQAAKRAAGIEEV